MSDVLVLPGGTPLFVLGGVDLSLFRSAICPDLDLLSVAASGSTRGNGMALGKATVDSLRNLRLRIKNKVVMDKTRNTIPLTAPAAMVLELILDILLVESPTAPEFEASGTASLFENVAYVLTLAGDERAEEAAPGMFPRLEKDGVYVA